MEVIIINCDGCGKQCPSPAVPNQIEYASLSADWGYGSARDGQQFRAHFCEDCFELIVTKFKLEPQ